VTPRAARPALVTLPCEISWLVTLRTMLRCR
jgi:hypothetical protein